MQLCTVSANNVKMIWISTLITSILSFIGSSFIIITYIVAKKTKVPFIPRCSERVIFIAVADLGWAINEIITFSELLGHGYFSWTPCVLMRVAFQVFSMAAVLWSTSIAISIFIEKQFPDFHDKYEKVMDIFFHVTNWGIPTLISIVMVLGHSLYQQFPQGFCVPREPWHFILWFIPISICLIVSLVLYHFNKSFDFTLIVCILVYVLREEKLQNRMADPQYSVLLYPMVLIFCWIFNIADYTLRETINCAFFPLVFGSNAILQFQGFLDSCVWTYLLYSQRGIIKVEDSTLSPTEATALIKQIQNGYSVPDD